MKTEPNKSLEPTRMLVTDPAAQAPRQAPVRLSFNVRQTSNKIPRAMNSEEKRAIITSHTRVRFDRSTRNLDYIIVCACAGFCSILLVLFGNSFTAAITGTLFLTLSWGLFRPLTGFIEVSSGEIDWDYSRFRGTKGKVFSEEIQRLIVSDYGSVLEVILNGGKVVRVHYSAPSRELEKTLRHFLPLVSIEFVEGT